MEEVRLKMFRGVKEGIKRKSFFILQIVFGILLLIFSIFAVVTLLGIGHFSSVFFSSSFVEFLLIVLGVVFIIEAIRHKGLPERTIRLIVGLVVLLFGALPLFHSLGMLRFLPVIIFLEVSPVILVGLLFFSALYFVVDRILMLFY